MSITVFPSKVWFDPLEPIDYADLDAGAQPLFAFGSGAVGEDEVDSDSLVDKIESLGGPALRGSFKFSSDFTVQAAFLLQLGQVQKIGVSANCFIQVSSVAGLNVVFSGTVPAANAVNLYAFNGTGSNVTIPKDTVLNFAIFLLL